MAKNILLGLFVLANCGSADEVYDYDRNCYNVMKDTCWKPSSTNNKLKIKTLKDGRTHDLYVAEVPQKVRPTISIEKLRMNSGLCAGNALFNIFSVDQIPDQHSFLVAQDLSYIMWDNDVTNIWLKTTC